MGEQQKKILLIEPPFCRLFKGTYSLNVYPLGLGYLAGTIKKETKWGVMAYNADFSPKSDFSMKLGYLTGEGFQNYLHNLKDTSGTVWNEVKSTIKEYNPDVIGISTKSQNFASARLVAKLAKEINPNVLVIAGGPHPSMVKSEVLNCPFIDIGVKGEGEDVIIDVLSHIDSKKGLENIDGIIYRKGNQVIENPNREFIQELDTLCFPHESAPEVLKDYDKYAPTAFNQIFAIRGCPFNCFFCGSREIWSRRVRFRSAENVVKEIKSLQNKGLKMVHFVDDTFGVSKDYIKQLCGLIKKECPGLKWSCELHVNLVDEDTISVMKDAGCYLIQVGIESGNNEMLKKIRKNITIEKAISACRIIKKKGLVVQTFFMVGFPEETEDSLNDTLKAMKKVKCDLLCYGIFTPYPCTEAFSFCKDHGLIKDDYDVSLYNHQSPANCFCANIPPERFRVLAHKIEKYVDRKNSISNVKRIFSLNTLKVMQEIGFKNSVRKGLQILTFK